MVLKSQLLFLVIILFIKCTPKIHERVVKGDETVNVLNFGAIPNDSKDDSDAFKNAFTFYLNSQSANAIFIPKGEYLISKRISVDLIKDLNIYGEEGTKIYLTGFGFLFARPKVGSLALVKNINRDTDLLEVLRPNDVSKGDIIAISSDTPWETSWNYKEHDTHIVSAVEQNRIRLRDSIIFNYDPRIEKVSIDYSKPFSVSANGLSFYYLGSKPRNPASVFTLSNCYVIMDNIDINGKNADEAYNRGMTISHAPAIRLSEIRMENLEYGILMIYSRNIEANNIKGITVRHALTPANACVNMYATNISGRNSQGIIDAHQSFNIHYDHVIDSFAREFPNCRALGTKITNSRFDVVNDYDQGYSYWSSQNLTDEYSDLYWKNDVVFDNVQWIHPLATKFNGLTAYRCRNFLVSNCKSHNVSIYGGLSGKALIRNSEIGSVRIRSFNVEIDNVIMDGTLNQKTDFVFGFSSSGKAVINDVIVQNYNQDRTYLFERFYNSSAYNSLVFKDSDICPLKAWTDEFMYPNVKYKTLTIQNSNFRGFLDKMPEMIVPYNNSQMKKG